MNTQFWFVFSVRLLRVFVFFKKFFFFLEGGAAEEEEEAVRLWRGFHVSGGTMRVSYKV